MSVWLWGSSCSLIGSTDYAANTALRSPCAWRSGRPAAFLVAQLLDIAVFNRLRDGIVVESTACLDCDQSIVDTAIFFTIAFSSAFQRVQPAAAEQIIWAQDAVPFLNAGPMAPLWVSLAVADWGVKIAIALIALVPFRIIIGRMRQTYTGSKKF